MMFINRLLTVCVFALVMYSCSKKTTPSKTAEPATVAKDSAAVAKKPTAPVRIKTPVPKVIAVNDQAARLSADGRLYYDLEGRRYWKNYKDGKYYLFNKNQYNNPDFRPHR